MAVGGIVELFFGVKAEQAALEDIAKPLTAEDAGADGEGECDEAAATPGAQRRGRDLGAEAAERERRRRFRLGPGRIGWSPGMVVSAPIEEVEFEREVAHRARASGAQAASRRRCTRRSSPGTRAASRATASAPPASTAP